jgi:hypothetical protein
MRMISKAQLGKVQLSAAPTGDPSGPKGTAFAACSPPCRCFQRRSYHRSRPDTLHTASEGGAESCIKSLSELSDVSSCFLRARTLA